MSGLEYVGRFARRAGSWAGRKALSYSWPFTATGAAAGIGHNGNDVIGATYRAGEVTAITAKELVEAIYTLATNQFGIGTVGDYTLYLMGTLGDIGENLQRNPGATLLAAALGAVVPISAGKIWEHYIHRGKIRAAEQRGEERGRRKREVER